MCLGPVLWLIFLWQRKTDPLCLGILLHSTRNHVACGIQSSAAYRASKVPAPHMLPRLKVLWHVCVAVSHVMNPSTTEEIEGMAGLLHFLVKIEDAATDTGIVYAGSSGTEAEAYGRNRGRRKEGSEK